LYNFNYDDVVPAGEDDTPDEMQVKGYTMVGLTPDMCSFNKVVAIDFPVYEGEE
jgi:hypothetical protein